MATREWRRTLVVGRDGKGRRFALEASIETRSEHTTAGAPVLWQTVEHGSVHEVTRLSICGDYAGGGGQNHEELRRVLDAGELELAIPEAAARRLLDIWVSHHLGDMRSGCAHQGHVVPEPYRSDRRYEDDRADPRYSGNQECWAMLGIPGDSAFQLGLWAVCEDATRLIRVFKTITGRELTQDSGGGWVENIERKARDLCGVAATFWEPPLHGQACLFARGYRYGHAWLYEHVPAEVLDEVRALFSTAPPRVASNLEERAAAMGLRLEIAERGLPPPADWKDRGAQGYRVRLRRGERSVLLPFTMGSAHTAEPTLDDVLRCLVSDAATYRDAGSFEDWCASLGFDADSRAAERMYRTVGEQTRKLCRVVGGGRNLRRLSEVA